MRPQLRTSTEQRRRSSSGISPDPALLHDPRQRRTSTVSMGSSGNGSTQHLVVPGSSPAVRRTSLCISTSALFSTAAGTAAPDGPRKRSSVTSAGSGMLRVPKSQDSEPRRRSLPGYMDGSGGRSHHSPNHHPQYCRLVPPSFDRRRSSVRPEEEYRQINDAGTKKMKIFGLVLIGFLALVIGVSFLKLFH